MKVSAVNTAPHTVADVILIIPVAAHGPEALVNVEPTLVETLNVSGVLIGKFAEQVVGQEIPAGTVVTSPTPVPVKMIVMGA